MNVADVGSYTGRVRKGRGSDLQSASPQGRGTSRGGSDKGTRERRHLHVICFCLLCAKPLRGVCAFEEIF